MAQALVRYLTQQRIVDDDGTSASAFAAVWAIFGHGNVAALGEALHGVKHTLPTLRGHNEQSMAHAAIAYAKAMRRRRFMACSSSIGPGATNMVTAAAVAHVNRLPVLLLPGDVFASRRPDPVLQQVEDFGDGTVSANDCFRPVSRYFDRIARPEQLLTALPRTMAVLTDPVGCGPVTLALCQDTQAEAWDFPSEFLEPRTWRIRRPRPDPRETTEVARLLCAAERPLVIAGGGVVYSDAADALIAFSQATGIPFAETQAGKGAVLASHPMNLGGIGVTGTSAANAMARQADLVLSVGTRLQDFTTGSWSLFANPSMHLVQLNVDAADAHKHHATTLVADAREGLDALRIALDGHRVPASWTERAAAEFEAWSSEARAAKSPANEGVPTDAQVIGAVERAVADDAIVVCAAGGLPGELHRLWETKRADGYHLEYGYSCMGYEIAGGLGVKLARPDRDVVVMVGDGSYLMLNSEIATSVFLGARLTIVLLDNGGFGCITRLQQGTGGERFNNLLVDTEHQTLAALDFVRHAEGLGARAERAGDLAALEDALRRARRADRTTVIVIETDPLQATAAGGHWWDVAVPECSDRDQVATAREAYVAALDAQRLGH
jgi:3D-(3,5/4)-trihydroxycyclohexane-1,2-dione acylhydrolase (decyclizing)